MCMNVLMCTPMYMSLSIFMTLYNDKIATYICLQAHIIVKIAHVDSALPSLNSAHTNILFAIHVLPV